MKHFTNAEALFKHMNTMNPDSKSVDIMSFNMRLDDYNKEPHPINEFMQKIHQTNHRIIVSIPTLRECLPGCPDCRRKYNKNIYRLKTYAQQFNIRFIKSSHMKYYRIGNIQFIGGINASPSNWLDVTMQLDTYEDNLQGIFEDEWKKADKDIDYVAINPNDAPSEPQMNFINKIENTLNITFEGKTKYQASKFISQNLKEFYNASNSTDF